MDAKWPAARVTSIAIDQIRGYEQNPRTHDHNQVEQLARAITRFGFCSPVLLNMDNVLIAGHGRVLAMKQLGHKFVPAMYAEGWTVEEERAYRIWDNQSALLSGWDNSLLKIELGQLKTEGADLLPMTGFTPLELDKLMSWEPPQAERELTSHEVRRLDAAWREMLRDWADILDHQEVPSTNYTRGALPVHFMRAQLWGIEIPRSATLPFVPHRLRVACSPNPAETVRHLVELAQTDDSMLHGLRFVLGETPSLDKLLACSLPVHRHRAPLDFPADLARDLINEFCPAKGRVLDPCHGWGGRALGFMLSHASYYTGFDVDALTSKGVSDMLEVVQPLCPSKKEVVLLCQPFESEKLRAGSYDFALTSPPYFDTEKYLGDQQSWRMYKTFQEWVDGFFWKLLANTSHALKDGAVFVLQVGSQTYPLTDTAKQLGPELGLTIVETRPTKMVNNWADTDAENGEVALIFRKKRKR